MPVNKRLLEGPSCVTKPKKETFEVLSDFKTGMGVIVKAGTVGVPIPNDMKVRVPRTCLRLSIPCEPKEIVIARILVQPVLS